MHILDIDHVQITVPVEQVAEARRFYIELLGLEEIEKPASLQGRGGFWLALGQRAIHVGLESGADRWATKAHVAYRVDDLAGWQAHLAQAGYEIRESIPIPGYERFETRDPFGNRVEFIALADGRLE